MTVRARDDAIVARYLAGFFIPDISEQFGLAESTVHRILSADRRRRGIGRKISTSPDPQAAYEYLMERHRGVMACLGRRNERSVR
jgi:hypothetical protein